jgi:hypothetical protein
MNKENDHVNTKATLRNVRRDDAGAPGRRMRRRAAAVGLAQQDTLGKVTFPTSCDPSVQPHRARRRNAHSYWFIQAQDVRSGPQDPNCAMATGIAVDLLGNTLVSAAAENLQMAWEASRGACDRSENAA